MISRFDIVSDIRFFPLTFFRGNYLKCFTHDQLLTPMIAYKLYVWLQGNVASVAEGQFHGRANDRQPVLNKTCYLSEDRPRSKDYHSKQVYLFEFDDSGVLLQYPSQILPWSMVKLRCKITPWVGHGCCASATYTWMILSDRFYRTNKSSPATFLLWYNWNNDWRRSFLPFQSVVFNLAIIQLTLSYPAHCEVFSRLISLHL